jgi:hypothetical protein
MTATPPKIKAIETRYKGHRFRSRLEARWAVVFDAAGIEWRYEEQGFDLGPELGFYLPDFFLPSLNAFVEVKAALPDLAPRWHVPRTNAIEVQKIRAVANQHQAWAYLVADISKETSIYCPDMESDCCPRSPTPPWPENVKRHWDRASAEWAVDGDCGEIEIACPVCGGIGSWESGYGSHYRDVSGHGDNTCPVEMWGECGHVWRLSLDFHKGHSFMYVDADFNQDMSPLERVILPTHLAAGRAARFEHGECG